MSAALRTAPAVPVLVAGALLGVSACGSFTSTELVEPRAVSATRPYDGRLDLAVKDRDSPDPLERSGAAGRALECDGAAVGGGAYEEGLVERGSSATEGLRALVELDLWAMPASGYRVEVEKDLHTLFSYDVAGRTRAAVIVARDETGHPDRPWAMSTFATCDQAEFPAPVDDDFGQRVWTDRSGKRVPTSVISSSFGAEHCDWQTVTFLSLQGSQYVGDPEGALTHLDVEMRASYEKDARLPADAVNTGYRLDANELWKAADGDSVYLVKDDSVERWPALEEPLYCK